jgi:hypothetical protein
MSRVFSVLPGLAGFAVQTVMEVTTGVLLGVTGIVTAWTYVI